MHEKHFETAAGSKNVLAWGFWCKKSEMAVHIHLKYLITGRGV
jgi:hypothetical protein